MSFDAKIVQVTAENLVDYPQAICFINAKHASFHHKIEWLQEQFKNGLVVKLLYIEEEKSPIGFIEYVPGEFCWRAVSAKGYMFIHCLWTSRKKYQRQGLGKLLLEEAEKDAASKLGVAVMTSDKSFMATKDIFIKNGYEVIQEMGKEQLLTKKFKSGPSPCFNDQNNTLAKYEGLTIIYSKQCPWVARFIDEVKPILEEKKLTPAIIELKTPAQAQKAPSLYGVFALIYDGKVYADRYISTTRFLNILNKEMKL